MANPVKPKLEALLENFKESGGRKRNAISGAVAAHAYCDGHDALAGLLIKLATCWKDIPPLNCRREEFQERLAADRDRRVIAFNEMVYEIEEALAQGAEAREFFDPPATREYNMYSTCIRCLKVATLADDSICPGCRRRPEARGKGEKR